MDSALKINYETRPCKFVERSMLLTAFQRVCNKFPGPYQYIGFGGLAFTDFKLFHRGLNIINMHSIEGGDKLSIKRLEYNKPYAYIQIHKDYSNKALSKLDLTKPSIVWLDYDGIFDKYIFDDMILSLNELPSGSLFLVTCSKCICLDNGNETPSVDEFIEYFGTYSPLIIKPIELAKSEISKLYRKMLNKCADEVLSGRNRYHDEQVKFVQLFDICYSDGAPMYTFGGVILKSDYDVQNLDLSDLPFVYKGQTEPFQISIPMITFKETFLLNKYLDFHGDSYPEELKEIVDPMQLKNYRYIYKFLPNFVDVHI